MTITTKIRIAVAGLVGAAILSPVALAGGEPKNDWPFTRTIAERTPAQVQITAQQVARGEPKNQLPFTRPVSGVSAVESSLTGLGEAKDDLPFTQSVSDDVTSGGFDWADAGVGVAAGVGLAAILVGGLILTYRGSRGRKIGAAAMR